jgi:hypothetical protein
MRIHWTLTVTGAALLGAIFLVAANTGPSVAMGIDEAAAPASSNADGTAWNSADNPNYPRLPALIVPPRGGDPVARP